MATVNDILAALDRFAPVSTALDFDNVGLLVGSGSSEVTRVLVALDVMPDVINEAKTLGAQLIVTHHPVIFRPISAVTETNPDAARALLLIESGIAAICMHTNLDIAAGGVNDALAAKLGLENIAVLPESDGVVRLGTVVAQSLSEFVKLIKFELSANGARYHGAGVPVEKVAVGGGSCAEYAAAAKAAGCDTLVVGDAKYSEFLYAEMLGINLVDAGHFATEDVVCPVLVEFLKSEFPGLKVTKSTEMTDKIKWI